VYKKIMQFCIQLHLSFPLFLQVFHQAVVIVFKNEFLLFQASQSMSYLLIIVFFVSFALLDFL